MNEIAAMHPEFDALNCAQPARLPASDPRLIAEGWTQRFLADPARAAEVTELYRYLGFEVRAEPVAAEHLGDYCEGCQTAICHVYVMIYTRRQESTT
jgi:hypothetical protein